jgi:tellurite resistance protein
MTFIQRESAGELRPDQVRAMAHGLYHLAEIDGITEKEKDLIQAFLKEGNVDLEVEKLAKIPFSVEELKCGLDTMFLRKAFLRVSVLLAQADGEVSREELGELRRLAQALDVPEPLESLTADLKGKTLG